MKNIINKLVVRMNDITLSLVENPANDFASYRERVGQYNGLKEALEIITSADDEDELPTTF